MVYPIWPDEAFVAANFLERGYLDLVRPLDYVQVCPILFLWIELTVVRLFGFSEWSLRLFPALCGLASMVLFRHLATRVLRGIPLLSGRWDFRDVGFANPPYRRGQAVRIRPVRRLDLVGNGSRMAKITGASRYWWVLAAIVPVLLGLSYPSVFVATGLSLTLGPVVFRQRLRSVRWAYLIYNLMLLGSFLVIYLASTSSQSAAVRAGYRWGYWRDSFPPWEQPWKLVKWLISTHTGNMLAYPIGGANGASAATFAAMTIGIAAFWRRGRTDRASPPPVAAGHGFGRIRLGTISLRRIGQDHPVRRSVDLRIDGPGLRGVVFPIASSRVVPTLGSSDRRAIGSFGGLLRYQRPGPALPHL